MTYTPKPSNSISRRSLLAALPLTLAIACGRPALAFGVADARALIDTVVGEITRIINSGKSEKAMLADFEVLFGKYGDRDTIAQLVLGPDGRSASSSQKRAFAVAFQGYLSRKYGRRFREFIGGRIEVRDARSVKSFYEVTAEVYLKGEAPFLVEFVVAAQTQRFIDLRIEGISVVKAERTEIGALLDERHGDLDRLIRDLPGLG